MMATGVAVAAMATMKVTFATAMNVMKLGAIAFIKTTSLGGCGRERCKSRCGNGSRGGQRRQFGLNGHET